MKLVVVGVNHKTAPVALREQLAFGGDLAHALTSLKAMSEGVSIVSTCNRSEIYVGFDDLHDVDGTAYRHDDWEDEVGEQGVYVPSRQAVMLREWLADFKQKKLSDITPYLYTYEDGRALNHWLRVASGLDSMILGEPQILGQIRQAVAFSHEQGTLGTEFGWLTQQIFAAAKSVRRDTSLGKQAVTLGFATAKLVTQIFDKPENTTLLIVAAGEMNRLVALNVAALGMTKIIIANRSQDRASALAGELKEQATNAGRALEIELIGLDGLDTALTQADVVSSCSGSMQTLISTNMIKVALKARKYRSMLLVDLAVPRDIESSAGKLDNVYLYSIDDLEYVIAGNIESRKQAAVEAELMVSQLTSHIESQMQMRASREFITQYRTLMYAQKDKLLASALDELAQGGDVQAVLQHFAHSLTNTLIHPSSRLLRHSAKLANDDVMSMIAHELMHSYRKK